MVPNESADRLVIGIDFGTTFSGVAAAYCANSLKLPGPDDIYVVQSWPGGNRDKVPSRIAYNCGTSKSSQSSQSRQLSQTMSELSTSSLRAHSTGSSLTAQDRMDRMSQLRSPMLSTISAKSSKTSLQSSLLNDTTFDFDRLKAALPTTATNVSPEGSFSLPLKTRWGYQLQPGDDPLEYVKLLLDDRHKLPSYLSRSRLMDALKLSKRTPVDVVGDYLTELYSHARKMLGQKFGEKFMSETRSEVVLTVPAVWSDAAKDATRKAAQKAGMGERLRLISEPEAAAVYVLQSEQPNHLRIGDGIIVCDAGGGTVDLISYKIESLSPLRFSEAVTGTGDLCGSAFLNARFEEYVKRRLGSKGFTLLCKKNPKSWYHASKYFEDHVKPTFDPLDDDCEEFNIPFSGVRKDPNAGIYENDFISMNKSDIQILFSPLLVRITELLEAQKDALERKHISLNGIVLVGGFGQSPCLYKCIKAHFSGQGRPVSRNKETSLNIKDRPLVFEVLQPINAWTAVVRGAVLRGTEVTEMVVSRKSRSNYGVAFSEIYNAEVHDLRNNKPYWSKLEEQWEVTNQMEWYIKRGQTVSSTDPVLFDFYRVVEHGSSHSWICLVVCDLDDPPDEFSEEPGSPVRNLCRIRLNYDQVASDRYEDCSNSQGVDYRKLNYKVGMQVESGILRFDVRINGKVYADARTDFVFDT